MVFKRAALLASLLVAASATPLLVREEPVTSPNFVNQDGTIDLSSLFAAAAIKPDNVPPAIVSTHLVETNSAAIVADVAGQAAGQTDASSSDSSDIYSKRDVAPTWAGYATCGTQLATTGPLINSPDTVAAFQADSGLNSTAMSANTPASFTLVYAGKNAVFQTPTANTYLGNLRLDGYDPQTCADQCVNKVKNCQSFNIYYERNPSISMTGVDLSKCNNPPSITRIGCQFFGVPITPAGATSIGQFRGNYFKTAKAGSNAYSLPIPLTQIPGTKGPVLFPNGKIDNQLVAGLIAATTLLTVNPSPDPTYCYNLATQSYSSTWKSFLSYSLLRQGVYAGQGCLIYTAAGFNSSQANDKGQYGAVNQNEQDVYYTTSPAVYYERQA
ncbi:hypothetical protein OC846_006016 [Tilletia horrida]|uniref:Uncharacterized protein n=1 Tax=Tilletia horrida TaxID=155126 RepID=A0AAN6JNZ8_9BASI|nr:hypothetical protein OC845_005792 [Tilletia horrida]KAK0544582.1 hypothetical protein OC846_006016 [Tilletia horrida]KAK0560765.1 hypothetical protein OC861_006139 [Tilletia horrida]